LFYQIPIFVLIRSFIQGFIIQREEKRATAENGPLLTFESFEPYLWCHVKNSPRLDRDSFHDAVDEFFSKVESQKLDLKVIQQVSHPKFIDSECHLNKTCKERRGTKEMMKLKALVDCNSFTF